MSLGGGGNSALDTAIRNSIIDGVTYVVAAGNSSANACNCSPSRVTEAITVGATTSTDAEASFSNYGTCVDLLAPGVSITSAWRTSDTATNTISGTSMASPHVAGGAARVLQANSGASPATVAATLTGSATAGVITLKSASASAGTPNRLLYLASGSVTPLPTVDSFTATLSTITLGDSSTLAWTATNATSWSINNGVGAVSGPNDSVQVSPTATTTTHLHPHRHQPRRHRHRHRHRHRDGDRAPADGRYLHPYPLHHHPRGLLHPGLDHHQHNQRGHR